MAASNTNEQRAARYVHELNAKDGEEDKGKMSCKWFLDRAFYCVSKLHDSAWCCIKTHIGVTDLTRMDLYVAAPGNQMTHFYRQGTVDECKATWANMYHCFRASMMDEDKRAVRAFLLIKSCSESGAHGVNVQTYLKDTPLDPAKPPYSAGVWEEKETPGW